MMKTYVIIGHSSGIGLELCNQLAKEHFVVGTYCKNETIASSTNVQSFYLNVLDEDPDFSFLPETIDGLVYCPGAVPLKPFHRFKPDDFMQDYQLQVLGAVKCIQACLDKLKKGSNPSIVMFSSVAAQTGFNFHSVISSSKGAIEGLTKALAAEFAPTIRVNCIAPSITNTALTQNLLNSEEKIAGNAQRHPLKRIGEASDIASLVKFLLSDDGKWMTGQVIGVDGGIGALRVG